MKYIAGLVDKGTRKVVILEDIPPDPNVLNGRFVLVIKNENTDEEIYKARFGARGHRERKKKFSFMKLAQ